MDREMKKVKNLIKNKKAFRSLKQILNREGISIEIKGIVKNKYKERIIIAVSTLSDDREVYSESFADFDGFSVYAIPVDHLDSGDLSLSYFPNAFFYMSTSADGASTQKSVIEHIEKNYSVYKENNLYAYHLDSISIPEEFQSTGIGTLLFDAAKKEIANQNVKSCINHIEEASTHIYAELPPTDGERYADLVEFYQTNGFVCEKYPIISCLI